MVGNESATHGLARTLIRRLDIGFTGIIRYLRVMWVLYVICGVVICSGLSIDFRRVLQVYIIVYIGVLRK